MDRAGGVPPAGAVAKGAPLRASAFHVIGTMMDVTYVDGNPANPLYGLQTWNIAPGGGAMFEMQIPDAGLYPFVTHSFAFTGLGAVGVIKIDPDAPVAPGGYPTMTDPFDGGVRAAAPPKTDSGRESGGTTNAASGSMGEMPAMGGTTSGAARCDPSGTKLSIAAQSSAFSTDCLAAPAGKAFTIAFDNRDAGVPHNVSIYTDASPPTALFTGDLVSGPKKIVYQVPALEQGTYFFRCDVTRR